MKYLTLFLVVILLGHSCKNGETRETPAPPSVATNISPEKLKKEIHDLESHLLEIKDAGKEAAAARALIEKSEIWVKHFPKDTLSPTILFKAADVARGLGEYGKAIEMWGRVWRDYPDFEKAPFALFLQGFTFDANLNDAEKARQYYETFLKTYPNSPLTGQVRQLLSVLGQSPDELVREFEKKKLGGG